MVKVAPGGDWTGSASADGQPGIKIIDSAGTPHHLQGGHTGNEVGWSFMRVYTGETTPPDF